ncbi:conserved hypothetical integral membrane protein [Evansella caseinilytica]|uniref:Conserved hypothetical integral membrane protein n=1 Tax=Evansella caseinilytica TaxID=1503961 RepID=A0A1H3T7K1_9BACI|nr:DUF1146 family protein [Evansella caseinilytica]SDZ46040.1 conserved hypothetical integral membrane protein [Evansella caseinilytica]
MLDSLGQQGLLGIIVNLMVLTIVWWSIQSFNFDVFFKKGDEWRAKVFVILITIALTHLVSSFLLNYLNWSMMLRYLF